MFFWGEPVRNPYKMDDNSKAMWFHKTANNPMTSNHKNNTTNKSNDKLISLAPESIICKRLCDHRSRYTFPLVWSQKGLRVDLVRRLVLVLVVMLLLGLVVTVGYRILDGQEKKLYDSRPDLLFVLPKSALSLWIYMLSPLVDPSTAAVLYDRIYSGTWGGHATHVEWYDPARHNNVYRHVEQELVSTDECQVLREMIVSHTRSATDEDWNTDGLLQEFNHFSALELLLQNNIYQDDQLVGKEGNEEEGEEEVEEEDIILPPPPQQPISNLQRQVLYDVLERIHRKVEQIVQDENIFVEFADTTVRWANPPQQQQQEGEVQNHERNKWWFQTSSGHSFHADQCEIQPTTATEVEQKDQVQQQQEEDDEEKDKDQPIPTSDQTWWNWWLPEPSDYSVWNHPMTCVRNNDHCCFFRTHTVLLYLNDPSEIEQKELEGGELYLLDRNDLTNPNRASYSSHVPLSEQANHVLLVPPVCGTLVVMASDSRNIHGTLPMQKGKRVALPLWMTSHKHMPPVEDLSQLEEIEELTQSVCDRRDSAIHQMDYPPPTGLLKSNDCESWLDQVRDGTTLQSYRE